MNIDQKVYIEKKKKHRQENLRYLTIYQLQKKNTTFGNENLVERLKKR